MLVEETNMLWPYDTCVHGRLLKLCVVGDAHGGVEGGRGIVMGMMGVGKWLMEGWEGGGV